MKYTNRIIHILGLHPSLGKYNLKIVVPNEIHKYNNPHFGNTNCYVKSKCMMNLLSHTSFDHHFKIVRVGRTRIWPCCKVQLKSK